MRQLISVIVPAYNAEAYVIECLTSLAEQTYKKLEIVFVDDGSTDGTLSAASAFLKQSGANYKIVDRGVRGGVSAARNAGIEASAGDYFSFLDSDDFLLPDAIAELYEAAKGAGGADVTLRGHRAWDEVSGKEKLCVIDKRVTAALPPDVITAKRLLNKIPPGHFALYKSDFVNAKGITFSENCCAGEDIEFMLKTMAVSEKIAICHDAGYVYRFNDGMGSRTSCVKSLLKRYYDHTEAQARCAGFILENCESPLLRRLCRSLVMPSVVMRRMSHLAMTGDRAAFDKAFSEMDRGLLLESRGCFLEKPEVFLRALYLLALPDRYYKRYAARYR